jgi:hypothetical protein
MWSVFGRRKLESLVKFLILILKVAIDATGPRVLNFFSLVLYCLTVISLCTWAQVLVDSRLICSIYREGISLPHNFHENYATCSGNPMSKSIKMHLRYLLYIYISVDWCNQKTASLYTYQSTYAITKRHIIAVLHISKPWKWKKKWKRGGRV